MNFDQCSGYLYAMSNTQGDVGVLLSGLVFHDTNAIATNPKIFSPISLRWEPTRSPRISITRNTITGAMMISTADQSSHPHKPPESSMNQFSALELLAAYAICFILGAATACGLRTYTDAQRTPPDP